MTDSEQRYDEDVLIKQLGYNPTSDLPDHEWEAMKKRNELSKTLEENANDTST